MRYLAERPYVDKNKCTGCGTCVEVCPVQVFEIKDGKAHEAKPEACINCKACEVSCPAKAITVK